MTKPDPDLDSVPPIQHQPMTATASEAAEICRLIKRKLKAADAANLKGSLPKPDVCMKDMPSVDTDDNASGIIVSAEYYAAITKLCRSIIK